MMRLGLADKIVAKLLLWRQIAVQREELGRMSDELLKDIGISRVEAAREAQRPFWDTDIQRKRRDRQKVAVSELNLKYH